MEKKLNKALDDVVFCITDSFEFKECIRLKEKMENNKEIKDLVEEIKKLQKQYVRSEDIEIKSKLDSLNNKLENIPIYNSYQKNLDEVNKKIELVKDELNDYFYKLFNN